MLVQHHNNAISKYLLNSLNDHAICGLRVYESVVWIEVRNCLLHKNNQNTSTHHFETSTKSLECALHVSSLIHGNHAAVILFVHPDEKSLLLIVPGNKYIFTMARRAEGEHNIKYRLKCVMRIKPF